MKTGNALTNKILTLQPLMRLVEQWHFFKKTVAFTNGCFDILHQGHISTLNEAANNSDFLIVGLNSDDSVKKLKGASRPINSEQSRAMILASLMMVDAVIIFSEETPLQLIQTILPGVLVKGGDYKLEEIVGAKEVEERGGKVIIHPHLHDFSTSAVIEKLKTTTTETTKA